MAWFTGREAEILKALQEGSAVEQSVHKPVQKDAGKICETSLSGELLTEATLALPWPPSVNKVWVPVEGQLKLNHKVREYRRRVAREVKIPGHLAGRLWMTVEAFPPRKNSADLDNLYKVALDSMQHAGFFSNDAAIDRLEIVRKGVKKGGLLVVTVRTILEENQS